MMIYTKKRAIRLTLEMVFARICFLAGLAFVVAALLGLWRHFFTMGLCFAVGIMMTDDADESQAKKKRHSK